MIKMYLYSIAVYAFIILCAIYLCQGNIKKNGWDKYEKSDMNPWIVLLCASAIPIIRLLFIGCIFYMACYTMEQFEEWKAKIEKEYAELDSDNVDFTSTYDEDE